MLKEAYEDYWRHRQDTIVNNTPTARLDRSSQSFQPIKTQEVAIGDIVQVKSNQPIPADIVLLTCSNPQGLSFINTMNLDGETNLKERTAHESIKKLSISELCTLKLDLNCDLPNPSIHSWNCNIKLQDKDWVPLSLNQLLLRGCVLKNTDYVTGFVIYTGHETKIMLNSKAAPSKASQVLKKMNKMLYTILTLQAVICFLFAGLYVQWSVANASEHVYLDISSAAGGSYVIQVLAFYVAYSHFIPISLYVMLEIVKLYLSRLIGWDRCLYFEEDDRPASCRTSDLVEELGQVEFVFSDKTGTLTRNVMEFRRCSVAGRVFDTEQLQETLQSESSLEKAGIDRLFTQLSLCHSVFPTPAGEGKYNYQAASPDELALVQGSAALSYVFSGKEDDRLSLTRKGQVETYQLLAEIPFDSTRKRMSVLLREPSGKVLLMCKGADNIMLALIRKGQDVALVKDHLDSFAREGLRTLVIAQRYLEEQEATAWLAKWNEVMLSNAKNKAELIDVQGKTVEKDLELVGVTAIEDKLQEGVPDTIQLLMKANIRVWVLTGDKQETAIEIGKSCHLLTANMHIEDLSSSSAAEFLQKLQACSERYSLEGDFPALEVSKRKRNAEGKQLGIVIDGPTLTQAMQRLETRQLFFKLGFVSDSCICCRVSPAQKAEVVKLAKVSGPWVTLSIGDGANDVSMIQEAHIGVGIAGKEGAQAVQASDFAFSQFKYLQRLLLVHGRWNYRRISWFICYYFYKNITVVFTELWFAFFNGFSSQIYFADWLPQLYNSFWTSWPCMFTFVYERDLTAEKSLQHPVAYGAGQRGLYFTYGRFWMWIALAITHGLICFWVPAQGYQSDKDCGLWLTSTLSFTLIIHVVNLKLFLESIHWSLVSM
jgi:phospholipid-transporting ATPase